MKTIGLLGGMSWESTLEYYRLLNEGVKTRLGGFASASLIMASVNFAEVRAYQEAEDWDGAGTFLAGAARRLQGAGADCILLATNTMHLVAPAIQATLSVPFVHIIDVTAAAIRAQGLERVALLGTRFTMEKPFYVEHLRRLGLQALLPEAEERDYINGVIFNELCLGRVETSSRQGYQRIIERLAGQGAQGVILGCTELSLLLKPEDLSLPSFDTTHLHVEAALDFALTPTP